MINLKNLKSIFVVEDENMAKNDDTPQNEPVAKDEPVAKNESVKVETKPSNELPPPPVAPKTQAPTNEANKRFVEILTKALEKNNQQGFDYLEFRTSLMALANLPLDEATRYRSAFATASTMGLTIEKLLQTAQFYKSVLDKEKDQFTTELNTRGVESIRARSDERVSLENLIKEKQTQIDNLQQQIAQHQADIAQLSKELEETSGKIKDMNNGFLGAYEQITTKITSDIDKIKSYLQ